MNPSSRWLLVVLTFSLLAASAPAVAAEDAVVLWTGTVQSASGVATPAEVTAYLQPPADATWGDRAVELTPIASTSGDAQGRFSLRAPYDDRVRAAEDRAGWVSVLVVAMTPDGMSMATDSVRYDSVHERWSTLPAVAEPEGGIKAQAAGLDAPSTERPAVMKLRPSPAPAGPRFGAMAARHRICYMKKDTREVGVTPVTVGELDLDQNWGGQFNYTDTDTDTSTFEVGFRYEGEGGWSAGDSTSFSEHGGSESINPVDPARHYRHHFYRADMMFNTFQMDCGGRTAYALRPTMWTGGMRTEPTGTRVCRIRYKTPVGPKASFVRQHGSSQTFSASFSIAGFGGGTTTVNSKSVRHEWKNAELRTRNLCGVSGYITRDTRVVSLPQPTVSGRRIGLVARPGGVRLVLHR